MNIKQYEKLRTQTETIHQHMEDDLSKRIYELRLLFALTGDYRFITEIVERSSELLRHSKEHFTQIMCNNIVVYGAGHLGAHFLHLFEDDFNIVAFCDRDEEKQKSLFHGYKVISPKELKASYADCHIVVTPLQNSSPKRINTRSTIINDLLNRGLARERIHLFTYEWEQMQYFDSIIPQTNEMVFVDVGCYNGNTSRAFIGWCNGTYKEIIAFEPEKAQYQACLKALEGFRDTTVYPYGLWRENSKEPFWMRGGASRIVAQIPEDGSEKHDTIQTVRLDDILNGKKVTYIKMDVESAELNALKGARKTIKKHHPMLAISMYHRLEDLWEIPSYILSLCGDYKFYFRHYSVLDNETVLYAI